MRPTTEEPVLGSSTRFRFHTTSSAVNCRPLCHLTVLAQAQRPRLQVGAGLPLLDEARAGDVVHAGHRQVVEDLTRGVGRFDPAIRVGALEVLAAHGEPQGAALGQGALGLRRRDQLLAGDLGHEGIGGRRRHAEQGCVAQELAALDLALGELALQRGHEGMLVSGSHGRVLPGAIVSVVVVSLSTPRRSPCASAVERHMGPHLGRDRGNGGFGRADHVGVAGLIGIPANMRRWRSFACRADPRWALSRP